MKKIVFISFGSVAIITMAVFNLNISLHGHYLPNLALANIEALAQNEDGGGAGCSQSSESWYEEFGCQATWYICNDGSSSSCIEGLKLSCPDGSSIIYPIICTAC